MPLISSIWIKIFRNPSSIEHHNVFKMQLNKNENEIDVKETKAIVFSIQRFSIQDGPGIRTTVFFKGCPLKCKWCSNPESQNSFSELFFREQKCQACGSCIEVCNQNAVSLSNGTAVLDRNLCDNCMECVDVCCSGAFEITGQHMNLESVFDEIERDALFYQNSKGGVTLSGGEPLSQPEFALELLKWCKQKSFDTTIDTCGFVNWEVFEKILPYTDRILFDLKHLESSKHFEGTEVKNKLILENLDKILKTNTTQLWIRIPVISGYNDSNEHFNRITGYLKSLRIEKISLLAYHQWGAPKYSHLGKDYSLLKTESPDQEKMESLKEIMEDGGLNVTIGY